MNPIISKALSEGRTILLEPEAKELCSQYGIPVPSSKVVKNVSEAVQAAMEIGFPVVVKIVSEDIIHKTDVGCVVTGVNNVEDLKKAYEKVVENALKHNPRATIRGVLIEEMVPKGVEVAVGGLRDPEFGPAVMFGLGGVFIEVMRDVSFRVAPVSEEDAEEMIREIKGFKLLQGYRGMEPVDLKALINIVVNASRLLIENEEIHQLDLNPIIASRSGAKAVDARVILTSIRR
ncbi:MAG: acetate--CoA ligase family protein [Candidatus Nezhaarchaeales archaeon]|nr:MAG: acetyl-CoA synthetase [Candidatus Nezhaarchaeota archaeon WYZ-LMO8]TDA34382.1 MAG: acetyl-CoA synthetase [Candidatus Nezhaarchaeota archaeon WYZ-LMO7]